MVLGNLVVLQNEWQERSYLDARIITVHHLVENFTHAFTSRCMLQNWRGTALAENNDVGNRLAYLGNYVNEGASLELGELELSCMAYLECKSYKSYRPSSI